jgi:hypothetical protein
MAQITEDISLPPYACKYSISVQGLMTMTHNINNSVRSRSQTQLEYKEVVRELIRVERGEGSLNPYHYYYVCTVQTDYIQCVCVCVHYPIMVDFVWLSWSVCIISPFPHSPSSPQNPTFGPNLLQDHQEWLICNCDCKTEERFTFQIQILAVAVSTPPNTYPIKKVSEEPPLIQPALS